MNKFYKNMTFCTYYQECAWGEDCGRRLTNEVKQEAIKWGGEDAPIQVYVEYPHCFEGEEE